MARSVLRRATGSWPGGMGHEWHGGMGHEAPPKAQVRGALAKPRFSAGGAAARPIPSDRDTCYRLSILTHVSEKKL